MTEQIWNSRKGAFVPERWWWPFPLAHGLGGSSAVVLGRAVYGGRTERPIIRRVHRMAYGLRLAIYWVQHRVQRKHQYHLVDTGLEPGYYDVDTLMLHACMALLCRYVELEHGGSDKLANFAEALKAEPDQFHPEMTEVQADRDNEALTIYRWWKHDRPLAERRRGDMMHALYGDAGNPQGFTSQQLWGLEDANHAADEDMLHRLIKIRRSLWT